MRRWPVVLSALAISCTAVTGLAGTASASNDNDPYTVSDGHAQAGPMAGIVPARDVSNGARGGGGGGGGGAALLNYHNGLLMTGTTEVVPVYWGSHWASDTTDKRSGLASFYGGVSGTPYMRTNIEYTMTGGAHVSATVHANSAVYDPSASPSSAPSTTDVINAVSRATGGSPVANAYYPVYVETPRGSAGYCAWHSYGTINNTPVTIGFFFNLDGDSGCDPQDPGTAHSQGLEALANVSGHELSEMVTDPRNGGYWDVKGAENSDKCAWKFGSNSLFNNGSVWKIQGNWSNAAYLAGTVQYAAGGKGCILTA